MNIKVLAQMDQLLYNYYYIINQPTRVNDFPKWPQMTRDANQNTYAWLLGAFCINTSIVLVVLSKYQ